VENSLFQATGNVLSFGGIIESGWGIMYNEIISDVNIDFFDFVTDVRYWIQSLLLVHWLDCEIKEIGMRNSRIWRLTL